MAIHSPPIWTEQCTSYFHQINETRYSNLGNLDGLVLGQYDSNGKLSGESQRTLSVCSQTPNFPGVHTKQGQECNITSQQIEFLGFNLDSKTMMISLPSQKLTSLVKSVWRLADETQTPLREIAQVLRTMVVAHPAILPAPLYYRQLEWTKTFYLNRGHSYDDTVPISEDIQSNLRWWIQEVNSYNGRPLQITQWDLIIESDASK